MDLEEAVKIGFLLIPPQSFLRKTWLKRYCAIYTSSNHGIQRIELFESEDAFVKQNPSKIIPLTDCIKVSPAPQKQQPNVFEVRTKNSAYQFSADTFQDMTDWLTSLQSIAFGKPVHKSSISASAIAKDEKQEENLLYSSMEEPEIYPVKAVSTEATLRNKFIGDYKLIITPVNLSIAEDHSQGRMGRIICTWPYRHIRRYGCTHENFSFEAGRKCSSGEGLFTFSTNDGNLIFQSVDAHVLALKSSQNEVDIPSSPSLNEDKNNFFTSKDSLLNKRDSVHASIIYKFEQTYFPMLGNDSEMSSIMNKSSTLKSAPLAKPPRKSKSSKSSYNFSSPNIPYVKDSSNEDSKFSPNLYEELYRGDSISQSNSNPDSSAFSFKTYDNSGQLNLFKADENTLCDRAEKLQIYDMPEERDSSPCTSFDYENCDPFIQASSVPKSDHVYGKLSNARQMVSANDSSNIYGSILPKKNSITENAASPVYSNVPFFQKSFDTTNISDDIRRDPDHFVKNDAEYAHVFKKNEDAFV